MEVASDAQRKELVHVVSERTVPPEEKIRRVKDMYRILHIEEFTKKEISAYFDRSLMCLEHMEVGENDKKGVSEFANRLLNREY
jgi:hypothetical protein